MSAPYFMNNGNYTPYQQQMAYNQQPQQMVYNQQQQQQIGYNQQQSQFTPQRVDFQGSFVSNFEEVKSYPTPIGSAVLLLDKDNSKFYMKMMDNNGNPLISTFTFKDAAGATETTASSTVEEPKSIGTEHIEIRLDTLEQKLSTFNKLEQKMIDLENRFISTKTTDVDNTVQNQQFKGVK